MNRSEGGAKCAVCEEEISKPRLHYGGITCYSCRAFFRRATQRDEERECKLDKKCKTILKNRKECTYCRYEKCLSVGMQPHLILSEGEKKQRFKRFLEKKQGSSNIQEANTQNYHREEQGMVQRLSHQRMSNPGHIPTSGDLVRPVLVPNPCQAAPFHSPAVPFMVRSPLPAFNPSLGFPASPLHSPLPYGWDSKNISFPEFFGPRVISREVGRNTIIHGNLNPYSEMYLSPAEEGIVRQHNLPQPDHLLVPSTSSHRLLEHPDFHWQRECSAARQHFQIEQQKFLQSRDFRNLVDTVSHQGKTPFTDSNREMFLRWPRTDLDPHINSRVCLTPNDRLGQLVHSKQEVKDEEIVELIPKIEETESNLTSALGEEDQDLHKIMKVLIYHHKKFRKNSTGSAEHTLKPVDETHHSLELAGRKSVIMLNKKLDLGKRSSLVEKTGFEEGQKGLLTGQSIDDASLSSIIFSMDLSDVERIVSLEERNCVQKLADNFWWNWGSYDIGSEVMSMYINWTTHGGNLPAVFFPLVNKQMKNRLISSSFYYYDENLQPPMIMEDHVKVLMRNLRHSAMLFHVFTFNLNDAKKTDDYAMGRNDFLQFVECGSGHNGTCRTMISKMPIDPQTKKKLFNLLERLARKYFGDPQVFFMMVGILLFNTSDLELNDRSSILRIQETYVTMLQRYLSSCGEDPQTAMQSVFECINSLPLIYSLFNPGSSRQNSES